MVLRRCRQMLGDEDHARDALHDVFARLLDSSRPGIRYPSSFLYTMATHICVDRLRSAAARHGGNHDLLQSIASCEDIEAQAYARRFLDRIFRRHEASTRVMAVLHYVDGMTLEEVAEHMELSASGVRKRLQRLKDGALKMAGAGNPIAPAGKEPK